VVAAQLEMRDHAAVERDVGAGHAEVPAAHASFGEDLVGDPLRGVDRDREADAPGRPWITAVLTPMTRARESSSGPPELPD
jgi:hypothetical protein